ncbi:MAG TPA: galactonate dehydratase [Chloroflexota bacterium]|nr:galactonate dehydratase [Chloroflexota bacterium]
MKITEVKTYVMDSPGREYVFIKISTDEGLYGWGEGTLEMKQGTVVAAVKDLEGFVIGQDPTRVDFLWQRMYRHGFWRGGVAILSALSGIEQALWDITGKAFDQPVYKLLGGAVRDYIPCYTHCGDAERALQLMEDGWRAFKSGPRGRGPRGAAVDERALVRETASAYDAMRRACGEDVELMCDVHGRLRPSAAIRLGQALQPFDLLFLEEAVPPDNILSLKRVREAGLTMDLATGERAFTKWGYREMLEGQYVDIIQPDLCHDGGIKETLKIGALAETYHVMVAPHNPNGPVGTAATVHAAAVMPNFLILEYAQSPTRDACQAASEAECFKARNGRIELPTRPGLGIDLDEAYLAAHPYGGVKLWPGLYYEDGGVADV